MTEHTMPEPVDAGSLASIDVGFDLRLHDDMHAELPVAPLLTVAHDGDEGTTTGTPAAVGGILRLLGYRIRWTWAGMPDGYLAEIETGANGGPVLVLRDPNDGQGDPATRSRHQYRVLDYGLLMRRTLPPDGDRWRGDPAPPWWEPALIETLREPHILLDWRLACEPALMTAEEHQYMTAHIAAWTPNGREVRYHRDGGIELQPPLDNWWHVCDDLAAARRWWYEQTGSEDRR
jgi:hypothetical protein